MSPDDRLKIATARLVGFCQSIENVRGYADGNQEVKIPIAWVNSLLRATGVCNSILDQVLAETGSINERAPVDTEPLKLAETFKPQGLCVGCAFARKIGGVWLCTQSSPLHGPLYDKGEVRACWGRKAFLEPIDPNDPR